MEKHSLVRNTYNGLKKRLELSDQYIYMQDRDGNVDRYTCELFNRSVSDKEIEHLITSTGLDIPTEYLEFLKVSNGCSLFNHELFGGENLLFPIDQVEYLYNNVNKATGYLQIGTIFDDSIVIDCNRYKNRDDNYLLVGPSTSSFDNLRDIKCNFETWFYRFVITNGSQFWLWY